MPFTELRDGLRMHYELLGDEDNPPVVTVHGWLGTPERDLKPVNDWLAKHFRVYSPTLRGYGESRPPQRDFPVDFYERDAKDVLAFMDAVGLEHAHLVGYSDGGESSLIAAGLDSSRFGRVFFWGAVGYFGKKMESLAKRLLNDPFLKEEPDVMALHGIDDADAFIADWVGAVVGIIEAGGEVSVQYASQIHNPLLLLLGKKDTLNPAEYAQRIVELAPDAVFYHIPDSGHKIHEDQWEIFRGYLADFLEVHATAD